MSERKGGNMAEAMAKAQGNYIIINYSHSLTSLTTNFIIKQYYNKIIYNNNK